MESGTAENASEHGPSLKSTGNPLSLHSTRKRKRQFPAGSDRGRIRFSQKEQEGSGLSPERALYRRHLWSRSTRNTPRDFKAAACLGSLVYRLQDSCFYPDHPLDQHSSSMSWPQLRPVLAPKRTTVQGGEGLLVLLYRWN